jgi:predicted metalloendopeptidase
MENKLTLKLNENVIEKAKEYAKKQNTSLSKLVEAYLNLLTQETTEEIEITPLVKSLSGVIKIEDEEDIKMEYVDYLQDKYK